MSKYQARRINLLTGNWDPANWDTSRIDFDRIVEEAEGVIIRLGDGLNLDPCFLRYRDALMRRNANWAVYHLHRPSIDPGRQAEFVRNHQPDLAPAGVWPDLEVDDGYSGEGYYNRTNPYLLGLDLWYRVTCGLYSAAWFLNKVLPPAIQRRWAHRRGWWASYPNLYIPWGWAEEPIPYVLHQYTDRETWAGLPNPADASSRNPAVPLADFRVDGPPAIPGAGHGTLIGIHAILPDMTFPLVRTLADRGAKVASVLSLDNAGLLMEVKSVSPATDTLLRFHTPEFDGLQDIGDWDMERLQLTFQGIRTYLQMRWEGLSPEERAAVDLLVVLNEADPPTEEGWRKYGWLCTVLCQWATAYGVRLLLPGWNNGTPEYPEMVLFFSTGLAEAMVAGGHALNIHEGVHPPDNPNPLGTDETPIPGAPFRVAGAGPLSFRYRYAIDHLRRTGRPVPDLYVGEFYGGAYGVQDQPRTLSNFIFYDQELRKEPWMKGIHGFTMDTGGGWSGQDYNPLMTSAGMIGYIVGERGRLRATKPPPLPDVIAGGKMAQYLVTVQDHVTAGDLLARIGPIDVTDLRGVIPMGNTPEPPRWFELWPLGVLNPTRPLAPPNRVVTFYKRDGTAFSPQPLKDTAGNPRPVTWVMHASEHVLVGDTHLLRVVDLAATAEDWYVRAVDVIPA